MTLLVPLITFGVLFLISGLLSYYKIVSQSPCKVTHVKADKREIKVDSAIPNMKLYSFQTYSSSTKAKSKPNALNPIPVLFVPGHNGKVDQVRWLASAPLNVASRYQYFSIDSSRGSSYVFGEDTTAIHASGVINQAVFVNDALHAIRSLYQKQLGEDAGDVSVTVVGHSVGGTIARTAALLDNHPACAVRDLILLSSPIHSPPHSLDISNSALYAEVNKAWWSSLHNESRECVLSRFQMRQRLSNAKQDSSEQGEGVNAATYTPTPVTGDWKCPHCASKIRVLSISGGDIDTWVHPSLSSVDILMPRIANNTARREAINRKNSWSVQNFVKRFFYGTYHVIRLFVFGAGSKPAASDVSKNETVVIMEAEGTQINADVNTVVQGEVAVAEHTILEAASETVNTSKPTTTNSEPSKDSKSNKSKDKVGLHVVDKYKSITMDDWLLDVDMYIDPQHLTVRTSQLLDVGFPIDHEGILSCNQVLRIITSALDKLTSDVGLADGSSTSGTLASLAGLELNYPQLDTTSFIPPVAQILQRNHTSAMYKDSARYDGEYFISLLTVNFRTVWKGMFKSLDNVNVGRTVGIVRTMTYYFFATQASAIAFSYYFLTVATLITPLVTGLLGGNAAAISHRVLGLSDPSVHLFLSNILAWWIDKFRLQFPSMQSTGMSVTQWRTLSSVLALFLGLSVAGFHYYASSYPLLAMYRLSSVLFPLAAYGLALLARVLLIVVLTLLALLMKGCYSAGRSLLRATVWSKPVRHFFRTSVSRPMKKATSAYLSPSSVLGQLYILIADHSVVLLLTGAIIVLSRDRLALLNGAAGAASSTTALDLSMYALSVGCIVSTLYVFVLCGCVLWRVPIDPQSATHATPFYAHVTLLLLYTPALLLSLPTFLYSMQLLFGPPSFYVHTHAVLKILDPDRIHFCMALSVIALHLRKVLRQEASSTVVTIRASKWLMEALSASDSLLLAALDSYGGSGTSDGSCVHFDGGSHAIFEQIPSSSDVTEIARDVVMGPTYRVVACACPADKTFKSSAEWCEFCRCQACNPLNRFKGGWDKNSTSTAGGGSNGNASDTFNLADLNPDLLVMLCLVACLFVTKFYLYSTNSYLYALSLVGLTYNLRDYFTPILSRLHMVGQ